MEPRSGRVRPTGMVHRLVVVVASILLLSAAAAGCGQRVQRADGSNAPTEATGVGSCAADSAQVTHAQPIPQAVDLDHDGVTNDLFVTASDARGCPDTLFAKLSEGYVSVPLDQVVLDPKSAQRVQVPGAEGDLLAIHQTHPRGGYQVRLYAYDGKHLGEVTHEGNPLVPFVATDTRGSFVSASCADDAILIRQAVAHTPPGVAFAWDIREASYALNGTTATKTSDREIKDNVLDAQLGKDYPELTHREMFDEGCGA